MDRDLLSHYDLLTREAHARGLNCDIAAFATETLTIVDRPDPAPWPYTAVAITYGTGTLVSIDPAYRASVEERPPAKHYEALGPRVLQRIVEEGAKRGQKLAYHPPVLCFTLGSHPPEIETPSGLDLRLVDAAWMAEEQASGRFENGVGEVGVAARAMRNQFALALFDGDDPVAVAGVFYTYGMMEIGIDVVRSHRGRGLAPVVTAAAAREIIRREGTPYYGCAATNIRSHRNAEAVGFIAVCSDATVAGAG